MNPSAEKFREFVGYCLAAAVALYLLLSLYMLAPGATLITRKISQYYSWFVLPGPYFRDDRITTVPHFYLSTKSDSNKWTEYRNVEMENFLAYHDSFSYEKLKQSRYERFLARAAAKAYTKHREDLQAQRSFLELHWYLKKHHLPTETDSVRLLYLYESVGTPEVTVDTVFQYSYKIF